MPAVRRALLSSSYFFPFVSPVQGICIGDFFGLFSLKNMSC